MGSETIELEYIEEIEEASKKLKDTFIQAYINLHGSFQGITRISSNEIANVFQEIVKDKNRCYFHRLNLRRNGEWDEILIVLCGNTIIAIHGYIEDKELLGVAALKKLAESINKGKYTHGIIETIEIPQTIIKEKFNVSLEYLKEEEKPEEVEEKPRLKTEEKPPEIEEIVEKSTAPETIATIPLESSITRTESLPEKPEVVEEEKKQLPMFPPFVKPEVRHEEQVVTTRKPMVIKETMQLDNPILEFSEKLANIISSEKTYLSDAVIYGDPDRLEVEVSVTKLGWSRKREKMMRIAENIVNILSSILIKNRASQKELIVTVRHGFNAVRVNKKLS